MTTLILALPLAAQVMAVLQGDDMSLSVDAMRLRAVPIHLCYLGTVGAILYSFMQRRRGARVLTPFTALMFLWIALVTLSVLTAKALPTSFVTWFTRLVIWALCGAYAYRAARTEPDFLVTLRRFFCLLCLVLCARSALIYARSGGFDPTPFRGVQDTAALVAEASTVNAYLLLWCTPLLYFLPNRSRWTTAIFLLSLFFAVAPAKRGVVTTLIVAYTVTVTFLLAGGRRFGAGRWRIVLSGLALACMIGVFLFQNWGNYEIRLVDRWEQRRDAGRIEARELIWGALTDDLARRDAFALLVGSGFGSAAETVYSIIGIRTHAHNDWLDTAVNMGVLGVGVLFLMHVMIVRGLFRARRGRLPWFPVFLCSYLCLLVPTFISTTVNAAHALYLLMVLGYLMGLTDLNTTAARSDASVRPSGPGDIAGAQPLPFAEWRPAAMASVSAGVSRIPGLRPG